MSRIKELKEQYPELNLSVIDMFSMVDPTGKNKYLPLICRVLRKFMIEKFDNE